MKRVVNIALCLSLIGALACAPTYAQSRSGSSSRSGGSHSSSSYSSRSSGSHSSSSSRSTYSHSSSHSSPSHSSSGYHSSGPSRSSSSRSSYSSQQSSRPSSSSYSRSSSSRSYGSSPTSRSSSARPSGSYSSAPRSAGSSSVSRSSSSSMAPRSSSARPSGSYSGAPRAAGSSSQPRSVGTAPGTRGTYNGPGSVRHSSNDRIHGSSSYTRQPGSGPRPGEINGKPGPRPGGIDGRPGGRPGNMHAGPRPGNRPPGGPRPGAFVPHDRPAPFHGHHHHCYGCRIHSLPYGYVRHIWHDIVFYECAGIFYRCIAGEYFVCRPPYGYVFAPGLLTVNPAPIVINVTPSAARPMVQNTASAVNYYYEDGVFFFLNANGQYEVVEAPVGAMVEYLPEDFETVVIDGHELYKVDYTLFKMVVLQGKPMFEVIGSVEL